MKKRNFWWFSLIGISLILGCSQVDDPAVEQEDASAALCAEASAHLSECTGQAMSLGPSCDAVAAREVLDQSCVQLTSPGKADFLRNWLCSLGFMYHCPAPVCEPPPEVVDQLEGATRCASYIAVSSCAECDYYSCRENNREESCGEDGYYLGFARRYCLLFTEQTIPRLSTQGKKWIEDVRPCLQEGMEILSDTASCDLVREHGYSIHPGCYVDTGFCELSITDMLAILNTVAPQDLGVQPFTTAIQCLERWFDPLTMELTTEGWEQLEAEAAELDE